MSNDAQDQPSEPGGSPSAPSPQSVRWRSWPVRDHFFRAVLFLLGVSAVAGGVWYLTGRIHLAGLALLVLLLAAARLFIPRSFEAGALGLDQWSLGRRRRIPWRGVGRLEIHPRGVLLLPRADDCPMDTFHAFYLPWGRRRDEVLAAIHQYLPDTHPPDKIPHR